MASTNRIQKLKNQLPKRSLSFFVLEDAKSMVDLITSASVPRKSVPDFSNLDFKIASGLRKILTGNFKKQVTTAEGKTQPEKRSLTAREIAWMIYDFFKIRSDNEAILDCRGL